MLVQNAIVAGDVRCDVVAREATSGYEACRGGLQQRRQSAPQADCVLSRYDPPHACRVIVMPLMRLGQQVDQVALRVRGPGRRCR